LNGEAGVMSISSENSEAFAARWAEAWNRRAIEDVLEHFHEDAVFTSPTALAVVGTPVVRGKGQGPRDIFCRYE
jgi:ketosteroid isomerase-like protein